MEFLQHLGAAVGAFAGAHPFIYGLLCSAVGTYALRSAEAKIPAIVDWADTYQDKALDRLGVSPEARVTLKEHQVKDLRAAADELEKRVTEMKVTLSAKAAGAQPAPPQAP